MHYHPFFCGFRYNYIGFQSLVKLFESGKQVLSCLVFKRFILTASDYHPIIMIKDRKQYKL